MRRNDALSRWIGRNVDVPMTDDRPAAAPLGWRPCAIGVPDCPGHPIAAVRPTPEPAPLPPCPICGKADLFIGTDGKPGCPHCEVAVVLPEPAPAPYDEFGWREVTQGAAPADPLSVERAIGELLHEGYEVRFWSQIEEGRFGVVSAQEFAEAILARLRASSRGAP